MRIAYHMMTGAPEGNEWILGFVELVKQNLALLKSPDTEVVFQLARKGAGCLDAAFYTYTNCLSNRDHLEGMIQAEKDGFDAVMIFCFYDTLIKEARQALNIPVIGPAESAMLMASKMGRKFGIVTLSEYGAAEMEDNVIKCGLRDKAVTIRPIPSSADEQMCAIIDAREGVEAFKTAARELIKDGAEVIIPGCMVMAASVRMAPGHPELPNGLQEVDGVPVLDVISTQVLMAETMVRLRKAGSAWISRKGLYAQPCEKALTAALTNLPYEGAGIWRCS